MHNWIVPIQDAFLAAADPLRAVPMAAYMKGRFPFLGIQTPQRRKLQAPQFRKRRLPSEEETLVILRELWALPEREYHYCGVDLLVGVVPYLSPSVLPLLEELLTQKAWWDTVDRLATRVVGPLHGRYPKEVDPWLHAWIASDTLWLRRTALLYQLLKRGETDTEPKAPSEPAPQKRQGPLCPTLLSLQHTQKSCPAGV